MIKLSVERIPEIQKKVDSLLKGRQVFNAFDLLQLAASLEAYFYRENVPAELMAGVLMKVKSGHIEWNGYHFCLVITLRRWKSGWCVQSMHFYTAREDNTNLESLFFPASLETWLTQKLVDEVRQNLEKALHPKP